MTAGLGRGLALAGIGVTVGLAVVAALFGTGDLLKRVRGVAMPGETSRPVAELPKDGAVGEQPAAKAEAPPRDAGKQAAIDPGATPADKPSADKLAPPDRSPQAETRPAEEPGTPGLDILRVEPSGEVVLAGRASPKAEIELLRDNRTVARVTADESGQFAMDGLSLPAGNSELTLRSTAPDGTTRQGRASAVVVVDKDRKAQPLVALSEPDKPTRVLSMPGPVAEAAKDPGKDPGKPAGAQETPAAPPSSREAALPGADGKTAGHKADAAPVKIVSVDAQEGGRLFVAGQGAAWTSLRLYLNDTLVASGRSGADGRVAFTIGRGVRPGGYQIRIDQVDPDSGKVGHRAQVGFMFPTQLAGKESAEAPARTASRDATPSPAKPEARPVRSAEATPPASSSAAKPSASESPTVAAGASRPDAAMPSAEADRRTAEALSPTLPGAGTPPGASGTASSLTARRPEPVPAPGDQAGTVFVPEISTARIIRGDSLWQISRKTYGDGKRYTVIYDANQDQIRDPDLIYPGQIFVLPKDAPSADGQGAKRG